MGTPALQDRRHLQGAHLEGALGPLPMPKVGAGRDLGHQDMEKRGIWVALGKESVAVGGSLRSLPHPDHSGIPRFQGRHHGEEFLAGAGLEVEAGEGHEDPAQLGDGQLLRVIQGILWEKREFGAVQNRDGRERLDTSARDTSQVGK